ncbi:MAG: hypothetical protein JXQ90_08470 [Cyclobacteriaceae bacterium]
MKKFLTTLKGKWPEYLLEIFVLIVGIYGAFALESWNEERKDLKLEQKYLQSLKIELNRDLKRLNELKKVRQTSNESAWLMLNTEHITPSYEEVRKFNVALMKVGFWHEFVPNDNTFKELSNSGNLSLFRNDSVKIGLLTMEALNDEIISSRNHMRREFDQYIYDELIHFNEFALFDYEHMVKEGKMDIKYLDTLDSEIIVSLAAESNEILRNKIIRNGFKLSILNASYLLELYEQMVNQIQQTINHINQSLEEK